MMVNMSDAGKGMFAALGRSHELEEHTLAPFTQMVQDEVEHVVQFESGVQWVRDHRAELRFLAARGVQTDKDKLFLTQALIILEPAIRILDLAEVDKEVPLWHNDYTTVIWLHDVLETAQRFLSTEKRVHIPEIPESIRKRLPVSIDVTAGNA